MSALAASKRAFDAAGCAVIIVGFFPTQTVAQQWMLEVATESELLSSDSYCAAGASAAAARGAAAPSCAACTSRCRMPFPLLFGGQLASNVVSSASSAASADAATFAEATSSTCREGGSGSSESPADASADALALYAALGFQSSIEGTWSPQALHFYAAAAASGRSLKSSGGMDVHQMGGDIMTDARGHVLAAHYSATSTDRPSVEALLEVARAAVSLTASPQAAAAAAAPTRTGAAAAAAAVAAEMHDATLRPAGRGSSLREEEEALKRE